MDDASGDELLTINRAGVRLTAEGERRRDQRWQLGPPQAHWQPTPLAAPPPLPLPLPAQPYPPHVLTYQKADQLRLLLRPPPKGIGSHVWIKFTMLAVYLPLQAIHFILESGAASGCRDRNLRLYPPRAFFLLRAPSPAHLRSTLRSLPPPATPSSGG